MWLQTELKILLLTQTVTSLNVANLNYQIWSSRISISTKLKLCNTHLPECWTIIKVMVFVKANQMVPPEWMILSHITCFIQGEVIGFQVFLNSLQPCSTMASWWSL